MNCPNCGHAAPPTDALRCGHCNFKLPANPKPQASAQGVATLPCWNCRHSNAAETERCECCNAKLQTPARSAAPFAAKKPINPSTSQLVNASHHDE